LEKALRQEELRTQRTYETENQRLVRRLEELAVEAAREEARIDLARKAAIEKTRRSRLFREQVNQRSPSFPILARTLFPIKSESCIMVSMTQSTQTGVDFEGGIWDAQDGWPLQISTNAWARRAWRKARRWEE